MIEMKSDCITFGAHTLLFFSFPLKGGGKENSGAEKPILDRHVRKQNVPLYLKI